MVLILQKLTQNIFVSRKRYGLKPQKTLSFDNLTFFWFPAVWIFLITCHKGLREGHYYCTDIGRATIIQK